MSKVQQDILQHTASGNFNTVTIGYVVDTNDPRQMGRVRALCSAWGDTPDTKVKDLPWAMYVSPFAGMTIQNPRGSDLEPNPASIAYGSWNIPKVGSYVIVGAIDGDPSLRYWSGCIQPESMTHTMPHGRYLWEESENGLPDGPVDSGENPIEPLYSNMTEQFTDQDSKVSGTPSDPRKNMEWRTRGTDTQVSALAGQDVNSLNTVFTEIKDHTLGEFTTITQENGEDFLVRGPGYSISHIEGRKKFKTTGFNYDSHTYSWTTPGFHSISMDDRFWNTRMRLRTTSGNQVILDDTNERIYVSTAKGKTWVELDQVGNVDIYADRNVSVNAKGDINYSTEQTFRVKAKEGIHMHTDGEYRVRANDKISFNSGTTLHITSEDTDIMTNKQTSIQSGANLVFDTGQTTSFNSSSDFIVTASTVNLNTAPAPTLSLTESEHAFFTSRVPEHEPWARVFMSKKADQDKDNQWEPEFSYTDSMVGKGSNERGEQYERNRFWRR